MTDAHERDRFVRVRGAREHNLKNVDVDIPRDSLVVFTGISGSGKSSLAFGTLYAEAQRRYFESVAPYARRLIEQAGVPDVDSIDGLPPAVALQQQRGTASTRSTVGSVTTLSNLLRMLYSRSGSYKPGRPMLYAEDFSPNTPEGACATCHGLGYLHDVTEQAMVPDPSITIRNRAIASWPPAWQGQNLRDILVSMGIDVDVPWRKLSRKQRDWILYTDEQPTVPVYAGFTPAETRRARKRRAEPSYQGTFIGARKYVLHTFATTQSALMKRRVSRFMTGTRCKTCDGKRLKRAALEVTFAGRDIGSLGQMPLSELSALLQSAERSDSRLSAEKRLAAHRITQGVAERIATLEELGLGYLSLDRSTPSLSPGELQRLRLATQIRSNLFGVVYVLDEPSAGLHPADTQALLRAFEHLRRAGNSLFVVEHDLTVVRRADWIVDVGPDAGERGGQILYSGPLAGLAAVTSSHTARYLEQRVAPRGRLRSAKHWLKLEGITRNSLRRVDVDIPLGLFTAVTGVSGSGKSSLVSQALVDLMAAHLGHESDTEPGEGDAWDSAARAPTGGRIAEGAALIKRLVTIDQKPIGRTPRSNLATYTGLFDAVRGLYAATPAAKARRFDAGRFSFNVAKGRCATCEGAGAVSVELLFMPSVYAPCPTCHGARYNDETLAVAYRGKSIADVLALSVDAASAFFSDVPLVRHPLRLLSDIGLGYLRLGQPATELSGGEAQRIKLATELQRDQRGATLYVIDEPTIGLHSLDIDRMMVQLDALVEAGNTVVVAEHDMRVAAAADWLIDMGPGAGDLGGTVVAQGTPADVAAGMRGSTARFLDAALRGTTD